jgi:Flp pilus assembly pilin Flp
MAQLLSALAMEQVGLGRIEYAMFAAITAIMVMFVVETVNQHS